MYYRGMTLKRTKPLRAKPRSKGNRAELEVREILRDHGYLSARRNFQSGGQGGGDLIEAIPGFHLEVKHHERTAIWEWIAQAKADARPTDIPAVIHRRNRSEWRADIPFEDLLGLLDQIRLLTAVERDDPKGPTGPTKEPAARLLGSTPHAGGPPLAQVGPVDQASEAGGHGVVPLSGAEGGSDA